MHKVRGDPMGIIDVVDLRKYFPVKAGPFTKHQWLKAVDEVSFSIMEGRVFSLVGESGCGKSTVARLVLRLMKPTAGTVRFRGNDTSEQKGEALKIFRKSVQIIFQDPFASLNPRMSVFETLSEPLKIHRIVPKSEFRDKVADLLRSVGLQPDILNRYPHEFSGGQRQRICIARALAVSPEVIVADEPLSALDVSIQAQVLNILQELKKKSNISFLFISHDLRVVQYFSDEVAVMYLGKIVEYSKADELFEKPLHPYTVVLLSSAPKIRPDGQKRIILKGDVPSPVDIPGGCPFHPRCPKRFEPCDKIVPKLEAPVEHGFSGRLVSCHLWNPY
jgi:peptide/nickel transport system ATP-binding protein/oligopeptide transport system ATP-binding protein